MKMKTFFASAVLLLLLTAFSTKSVAQETYVYQYTDTKTFKTNHMKIQYNGYQVSVWFKQTSAAAPNAAWAKRDVTYNDDHQIKYKIPSNGKTVLIEYDTRHYEAIDVTHAGGDRAKYHLVE